MFSSAMEIAKLLRLIPPGAGHSRAPATLAPFVKPAHVKVFEFSPHMSVEDVKTGVAHIKKLWGEE